MDEAVARILATQIPTERAADLLWPDREAAWDRYIAAQEAARAPRAPAALPPGAVDLATFEASLRAQRESEARARAEEANGEHG